MTTLCGSCAATATSSTDFPPDTGAGRYGCVESRETPTGYGDSMTANMSKDPLQQRPLDLHAPGALDALIAFHRAAFGDARMEADDSGGGGDGKDQDADKSGDDGDKSGEYKPPDTQADLDRIISDRLARERAKYADYADLKKKAEEFDKTAEAAKTEQQKAVDAARKEGEAAAAERANSRLVAAEARALAAEGQWRVSPAAVVRQLDLSGVNVSDSGEVDAVAIKAALADLAKSEPGLVDDGKARPKPDPSQGGGGEMDKPSVSRGREMYEASRKKSSTGS